MRPLSVVIFFILAALCRAVTPGDGPGGVGTTDGLSALELWVKADALGLTNGSQVAAWNDASGHGRHLTQGTSALRPLFVTSVLNGKPVVRFTADWFNSLTLPSTGNEFALVAVTKPTHTGAYHNIIDDENSGRPMLWIDTAGNYEFSFASGAVAPRGDGYDLLFAIKRGAGPQFSQLFLNGPTVTAGSGVDYTVAASELFDFFNRDGGQAFNGDVAELIIFSTALTTQEIGKIGWYLQQKYALPANFPPLSPVFSGYQTSPVVYGVNVAIVPNVPVIAGGTATSFSVAPALPSGLVLNTASGNITGTPTAVTAATNYTITATFPGNPDVAATLALEVSAPALLGYTRSPAVFTRSRPGAAVHPVLRGGPVTGFTVMPPLPAGLTLDAITGEISGTPAITAASASYAVTASFAGYPSSSFGLTLEVLELSPTLEISEFLASNDAGLTDGDGLHSDWIELHNHGAVSIDLYGWSLTDDAANFGKWIFPPRILLPGAYMIVFASGEAHTDPAGGLHVGFKLDADGEYLALVQPDGVTIAREFSPKFPQQMTDVSWGTSDRVTYGAYSSPTPGAANGFFDSVSARVTATPAGGTFTGTLNVVLAAPLPAGGVIRYTLDNTAPAGTSPVYGTPISITANSRLRARVFAPGLNPGPELREGYLKLGADVQSFSSNLPLLFLHTEGAIAAANATILTGADTAIIPVSPGNGRAAASGSAAYSGRGGLRIRGRSSQSFPQKQFKFETLNDAGRETPVSLLGLGEESDWVLHAPYSDKSLVRNALAYRTWALLGHASPGTRFVEVFINDDNDAQFSYADDYAGIYMLTESIKLGRLNMDGPQSTGTITGGFITETGNADDQEFTTVNSIRSVAHRHRDPGIGDLSAAQRTWIRDFISNFEQALYDPGFVHPVTGLNWRAFSDAAAQADYKIAREWSRNFDGGSTYSYIPRGGQLTMGPLWDYNWAFGNVNYAEGGDLPGWRTDGWNRSFTANVNGWAPWWLRMEEDADWWQQVIDRWAELRDGPLATAAVNALVDELTQPLTAEAAARHFAKWPQLGMFTIISPPGWDTRTTYQSEVDYLKTWLGGRSAWMDSQFPPRPSFSQAPGGIAAGSSVTISADVGQTIYYTTNGSDPRSPGGAPAAGALSISSGGSVVISSSAILNGRAKSGAVWGAPGVAAYVTGTPAAAGNVVISEIMYHPAAPTAAELIALPGVSDDDFEFLELRNVSAAAIDLTGARFTAGVDFTFPPGMTLAAGAHLVIVENQAAFALRYGAAVPVAGQYAGNLDNDGDTIVLAAASGAEIARIHYRDSWTSAADGRGWSLNLLDPSQAPADYSAALAWGLSGADGGSPSAGNGAVFTYDFTLWQHSTFPAADLADPLRSGPSADPDSDGWNNLLEFSLTSEPLSAASVPQITALQSLAQIQFTFTRPRQALDLEWRAETSTSAVSWSAGGGSLSILSSTASTETVRLSVALPAVPRRFARLAVTLAP